MQSTGSRIRGDDPHGKLVRSEKSEFSNIRIRENGSVRSLYFVEPPGLEVRQTSVDLKRSGRLLVPYTRTMFATLLFKYPQERVLIVGLGGVVAFNLVEQPGLTRDIQTNSEAFPSIYRLRVPGTRNVTIIASPEASTRQPEALRITGRRLDQSHQVGFSFAGMVDLMEIH